jgi:hypothetical protein
MFPFLSLARSRMARTPIQFRRTAERPRESPPSNTTRIPVETDARTERRYDSLDAGSTSDFDPEVAPSEDGRSLHTRGE